MVEADSIRSTVQSQEGDSNDDTDHDDDFISQDTYTDSDQDVDDTVNEWYYIRSREIEEEDEARGVFTIQIMNANIYKKVTPTPNVETLRIKMEQLEEDMDNARINEGTYIERSDALKEEYKQAVSNKYDVAYASRPVATWTNGNWFRAEDWFESTVE